VNASERHVFRLLARASAMQRQAGAKLVRRNLPALAATVDAQMPAARRAVAAAPVTTPLGWSCREAVYRLFDREQQLFRAFALQVASDASTWRAAARFGAGFKASNRRYAADIDACAAHASPEERPRLERTLHDF
jgi:hypothetical protein